jgi:hypothetical protein
MTCHVRNGEDCGRDVEEAGLTLVPSMGEWESRCDTNRVARGFWHGFLKRLISSHALRRCGAISLADIGNR